MQKPIMADDLPFKIAIPAYSDETLAAIKEARDIASGKIISAGYSSIAELNAELDAEYDAILERI